MKKENKKLIEKLKDYIEANYIGEVMFSVDVPRISKAYFIPENLREDGFEVDEPFNMKLFKLIDASGKSDVEVYKKAGIDRRHFSKIKSSSDYVPQKKIIMAFIIALELPLEEAESLLNSAGYSFSQSYLFDVILKFFITERIYSIGLINEMLLEYDQQLIGN